MTIRCVPHSKRILFQLRNKSVNVVWGSNQTWSIWCRSTDVTCDILLLLAAPCIKYMYGEVTMKV